MQILSGEELEKITTTKAREVFRLASIFSVQNPRAPEEACLIRASLTEGTGVAAKALQAARLNVEGLADRKTGLPERVVKNEKSFATYRMLAKDEAFALGENFIATEHILLAITSTEQGRLLFAELGLNALSMRATVLRLLALPFEDIGIPYPAALPKS